MSSFVESIAEKTPDTDTAQVAVTMGCALAFGVCAVFVSLWHQGTIWNGLLWAAAWSSVGWFLGFLFGIPRYLSTDTARTLAAPSPRPPGDTLAADPAAHAVEGAEQKAGDAEAAAGPTKNNPATASPAAPLPASSLTVNTNLEQISDWLTKIIVGVSLVESQALLDKMQKAAGFMARSMVRAGEAGTQAASVLDSSASSAVASAASSASAAAGSASAVVAGAAQSSGSSVSMESFAYAVMLYFLVSGLLGSYLLTRLFLQRALDNAAHAVPRRQ